MHHAWAHVIMYAGFIPNSMVSPAGRPEEGMTVRALFVEVRHLMLFLSNLLTMSDSKAAYICTAKS